MERQALGKYEKDLVEQAERYGILAMEMLRHTKADRLDAALFALEKQNEVIDELLRPECKAGGRCDG